MAEYYHDSELRSILEFSYLARIKEFIKKSQLYEIDDCNNLIRKMANLELEIFNMGR